MPSNLLSQKSFSTKTPAICHPPPPPPVFPPPNFQKTQFRTYVDWLTYVDRTPNHTAELFMLQWFAADQWHGYSHLYPMKPYVYIKFGVYFNPLVFRLLAWHWPKHTGWSQYHQWIDQPFLVEQPLNTGFITHDFTPKADCVKFKVQQKPF